MTKDNLRLGVLGYTVCWTLAFWSGWLAVAVIPCFFLAYLMAQAVQRGIDFFLDNRRRAS